MELTFLRPMAKRMTVQGWKTGACQTGACTADPRFYVYSEKDAKMLPKHNRYLRAVFLVYYHCFMLQDFYRKVPENVWHRGFVLTS